MEQIIKFFSENLLIVLFIFGFIIFALVQIFNRNSIKNKFNVKTTEITEYDYNECLKRTKLGIVNTPIGFDPTHCSKEEKDDQYHIIVENGSKMLRQEKFVIPKMEDI